MANLLNQDTTIIGLPAGCVGHDIHLTGYREGNIIILGKCSNHHICLRFRSGWGQDIPDSSSLEIWKFAAQIDEMTLRDSRGMNYNSKLQNMSWFCYNMLTHCPTQTWSHGSLTIKHYRVLVGNHHLGYRNLVHELVFAQQLLFLEQINQWLGVLRIHIEWRLQVSKPQNASHVCMTDLGWFQRKQHWLSRIHDGNLHQMHMNWRKSLLTSEHMLHELAWRKCLTSFEH